MVNRIEPDLDGSGLRIGVVVSRFNDILTGALLEGAIQTLTGHGVSEDRIDVAWVPGAYEIPVAAQWMAGSGRYQALVCLGAVVRGDTPHFDYICNEVAAGLTRVGLDSGLPAAFGVLTCDNMDQGVARAGGEHSNKGEEAALAALEMANLRRSVADLA